MTRFRYAVACVPLIVASAFAASPVALAATDETRTVSVERCVNIDAETLALTARGSPGCLAIKPTGELAPVGATGRCVALDATRGTATLVDSASPECVRIDPASRVAVLKGGANACFGIDRRAGVIAVKPADSDECLKIDQTSGLLTLVGSTTVCTRIDPRSGTLSPVGAVPAPGETKIDPRSGTLSPVGAVPESREDCLRVEKPSGEVVVPRLASQGWRTDAITLRAGVNYAEWEVPKAGVGTLILGPPGSEVDAILRRQDARGMSIDVSLMGEKFGAWEVGYFEGDATSRATEPVDGAQIGFVYHLPSPSGSLGLNTGRNGGEFKLQSDVTVFNFAYRPPFSLYRLENPDCKLDIRPEFVFSHVRTDYDGWSQSIRFPGIYSETRQEIEENRFGVGVRGHYSRRLGYNIVGRFVANLDLLYRDADLKSLQRNVCGELGCPPARTFDASVRDSDSGFTWEVGLKAGLEYSFTKDSRVGFQIGYRYLPETAALQNPTRTIDIDRSPYLKDASVNVFQVGVSYRYEF